MTRRQQCFLVVLLGVTGCSELDPFHWGKHKHAGVGFRYGRCDGNCSVDQPLLTGTRALIELTGLDGDAGVSALSNNPRVAVFSAERACSCEDQADAGAASSAAEQGACADVSMERCDNAVEVRARRAGDVTLTLTTPTNPNLAHVTLHVRDAASATFFGRFEDEVEKSEQLWLQMQVGDKVALELELRDDQGQPLVAQQGVSWKLEDARVAVFSDGADAGTAMLDAGLDVEVQAKVVGKTELRVQVPGLAPTLKVIVTR